MVNQTARLATAMRHDAIYDVLGFDKAADGDQVFRQLVCARIIEPTSKADSLRVLAETSVAAAQVSDVESPIAGVHQSCFPATTLDSVRGSCRARSGPA